MKQDDSLLKSLPFSPSNCDQQRYLAINTQKIEFQPSGRIEKYSSKMLESKNSP